MCDDIKPYESDAEVDADMIDGLNRVIDRQEAKIASNARVIAALREALVQAWYSRGPYYVEASHPGWCDRVRDLLSDADEQTAGENHGDC
jgi:hypothetical protein